MISKSENNAESYSVRQIDNKVADGAPAWLDTTLRQGRSIDGRVTEAGLVLHRVIVGFIFHDC